MGLDGVVALGSDFSLWTIEPEDNDSSGEGLLETVEGNDPCIDSGKPPALVQVRERLETLDSQISAVNRRLERLYEALETGKVDLDDLGPRLKDLRQRRNLLLRAKSAAQETVDAGKVEQTSREVVLG